MKSAPWIIPLVAAWLLLAAGLSRGEDQPAAGDERILFFRSEIAVLPDASMDVRETIRVRSAQNRIKRGIYRDFATRFRSSEGIWFEAPFSLTEVLRDGEPEPWETRAMEGGIRAYIGDKELLLEPGEHTYTIAYHTDRQLGFFKEHVELFWNVSGYDWVFPIDEIEARVLLPGGVSGASLEVQTGERGAKGPPASAGRCLVNRIEGLEACLAGTADQAVSRLGRELTPAGYEQLLPYAIALGREEQWSRQFADALNRTKNDGQSYQPAWIRTEAAVGGWKPAAFAGAVGGNLAAAIAASAAGASATSETS